MSVAEEEEFIVRLDGLRVVPDAITDDGMWMGEDGMHCAIREMKFPVPEGIKGGPYETQTVLAVLNAKEAYHTCPECSEDVPENGIL